MRIAVIMNLAPRKLGSFEGWITAMCQHAVGRGHQVDVYGRGPIHPVFAQQLEKLGVGLYRIDQTLEPAHAGIRRLSGYDVIHLNMFAPRSRMALIAYAAYPAKVMFVDHTSGPVPTAKKADAALVALLKRAVDSVTMVRVTGVAGVSDYVTERNKRRFGLKDGRARTIYNGVDMRRFVSKDEFFDLTPPPPKADDRRDLTLLTVCYLIKQKGVDHLVRGLAASRNRQLRLTIAGDGPEADALKALAVELGVADRVTFAGLRDDVPALLRQADIFVHPAIWEEAFGLTIAEAMASQCAVVATRIGGIPEIIEHERTGLLVKPGSAEEIARALDLLSDNPALRRQLAENARLRSAEKFALDRCAKEHIDWCEEAATKPKGARAKARSHATAH